MRYDNSQYVFSRHVKQRLRERGIDVNRFLKKDLLYSSIRNMVTTKEGYQIRYTKNNLKIVLYGNVVVTVYSIRATDIKEDLKRYKNN